jgi:hypothetical protein
MATIYKATGGSGENSTDAGTVMPLTTIEARLSNHKCIFRGTRPPIIAPVSTYFMHLVIAVTELDEKTPKFPHDGYYYVVGLQVKNAGFLFAPP